MNRIKDAALILIDVQKGFDDPKWGARNNLDAEKRMAQLLEAWRGAGRPVFHVQHLSRMAGSPLRPGQKGCEIKEIVMPLDREPVIQKHVNSAFIGTALEYRLLESGIEAVVLAGLTSDHCISTTARMSANLGFETFVVSDATATFDRTGPNGKHYAADQIHELALVSLHGEFATILDTGRLLESLAPEGVLT
ncbi:cysteine hydrolase [Candidatus Acetothermia bacterium]|nr:cysteine hydrolase [Candidatus Acetothermia bacterium]MBI3643714.1 cysteine hydrolase [Candidatus Acetothermia bacterium]